jgi:hypothetical protein
VYTPTPLASRTAIGTIFATVPTSIELANSASCFRRNNKRRIDGGGCDGSHWYRLRCYRNDRGWNRLRCCYRSWNRSRCYRGRRLYRCDNRWCDGSGRWVITISNAYFGTVPKLFGYTVTIGWLWVAKCARVSKGDTVRLNEPFKNTHAIASRVGTSLRRERALRRPIGFYLQSKGTVEMHSQILVPLDIGHILVRRNYFL